MDKEAILNQESPKAAIEMLVVEMENLSQQFQSLSQANPGLGERIAALEQYAAHGPGLCKEAECNQCVASRDLLIRDVVEQTRSQLFEQLEQAAEAHGLKAEAEALADAYERYLEHNEPEGTNGTGDDTLVIQGITAQE